MKKKKICIGVITVFIVILIGLFVLLKPKKIEIADNDMTNSENTLNSVTLENIVEENLTNNEEPIVENIEITESENTSIQSEENKKTQGQEIAKGTTNEEKTIETVGISKPKQQEQPKSNPQMQENNKTQPTTEEKINVQSNANNGTKETQPVQQDTITYKENSNMIEQMKQIIEDNKTEDMKKFGCSVVKNELIVNLTNDFTFTADRVISKVKYKFGTIQIYARDYYKNGKYQYTECFIL